MPRKTQDKPSFIGTRFSLHSLFGWFQATPVNLTYDEERLMRTGISGLEALNNSSGASITDGFKASDNPVKRMADMSAMAESHLVGPLLEVYAEEASQPDINKGQCLWYECNDPEVEKDLNDMYDRIGGEDHMFSLFIGVAGRGNEFRRVLYNNDGVQQLVGVPCTEMRRIWEPTTRRLLGFKWQGQKPRKEDVIYPEDETVFPPWHFIHFRRIYRSDTEYGSAILDKLYGLWRKLEMSIDQMVLYRLHTMPNRIAMYVDIGDQDITDSMETMHIYQTMMRQRFSLNQAGLESRYDMPALDSILYIPVRPEEDKTRMESMPGDKDVPDIPDIEDMKKDLYGGARVPAAYVGHGEESGTLAQSSLVSQDIRFARMIRVIRRPVIAGYYRLAQLHLALKGKDPKAYNIKVKMSRISSIEEEVNAAIMEKQVGIAASITDLCQALGIPNREIIDLVFREYLSVPRYFIDIAKLGVSIQGALGGAPDPAGGGAGGGMGGMGLGGGGLGGPDDLELPPPGEGDGLGDLDMPEGDAPGGGGDPLKLPPVEARRNRGLQKLNERRWTKRECSNMACLLREMSSFIRTNPTKMQAQEAKVAAWKLTRALHEHMSISSMRRVSLVDDYHKGDPLTEEKDLILSTGTTAHGMLVESLKKIGVKIEEAKDGKPVKLLEGALGDYVDEGEGDSSHPLAEARDRMRGSKATDGQAAQSRGQMHEAARIRNQLRESS